MRKPSPPSPLLLVLFVALPLWSACGETTGPSFGPVPEEPGEATLHDFGSASLRDPPAFDAVTASRVRPSQSTGWDFLFAIRDDGTPELRPRNAVVEGSSEAGLQKLDRSFSEVREAPEQGYVTESGVPVQEGDVLVGRSRQDPGFAITCHHFFKLRVVSIDPGAGTLTFEHLINPACGRRNLVPGSSNEP